MKQNIFTVTSQDELLEVLPHYSYCDGSCDWCRGFYKASMVAATLATELNVVLTFTVNEPVMVINGYYQIWCEACQDGLNDSFDECTDWTRSHAARRHGLVAS